MAKTNEPVNSNINTNTNNVNVKVDVHQQKRKPIKKKEEPNWYTRTIIGGIIALILSLCGYYIKNGMDKDNVNALSNDQVVNPIEANQ